MRATMPRLKASGRPRQGISPSAEAARSPAATRTSRFALRCEVAEDIGPRAVGAHRDGAGALAIAEALDGKKGNAARPKRQVERVVEPRAGARRRRGRRPRAGRSRIRGSRRRAFAHPFRRWGDLMGADGPPSDSAGSGPAGPAHPGRPARTGMLRRSLAVTTAGLLACGSQPARRLPGGSPSGSLHWSSSAPWHAARRSQLRGQPRIWGEAPHRIPSSLSDERPSGSDIRTVRQALSIGRLGTRDGDGEERRSPDGIDSTFRNGSVTAIGVVLGFSLAFLSHWVEQPGGWESATSSR